MSDELRSLASEIIESSKRDLLINLHFMNPVFSSLKLLPVKEKSIASDGNFLRYDPLSIVNMYKEERSSIAHMLLHVSLHMIFLHSFPHSSYQKNLWDTSCDIVVENIIDELNLPDTALKRSPRQAVYLAMLKKKLRVLSAETVYNYLTDQNMSESELRQIREEFYVDDHSVWYELLEKSANKDKNAHQVSEDSSTQSQAAGAMPSKDGTNTEKKPEKDSEYSHKSHRAMPEDEIVQKEAPENARKAIGKRFADTVNLDRSKQQWKNAAYEMGIQLDSYIRHWGAEGSNLRMNLKSVTRKRQDYSEFLRKFASIGEELKVNDDEFDYVFYCYGLSLYKNLPLIEALEYVEERKVRDFVIAIDTSSSTKDGLVRQFIEKTYSILSSQVSFSSQMNVLLIQCDAEITDVVKISSTKDMEDYIDTLEIKGLGGTDFRPVFSYVDEAIARGELKDLKGLIYFTDGEGTFPKKAPEYDVAFVFADEQSLDVDVPSWAMKIVL